MLVYINNDSVWVKLMGMAQSGTRFSHLVYLPLSGDPVGVPNLVDTKYFTEYRGQFVKEDLRHVFEIAGRTKITLQSG